MAPSPVRSQAAFVFFVLSWRRWLVGITNLEQVDFLLWDFRREFFQAGFESLLKLFSAACVLDKAAWSVSYLFGKFAKLEE
jgi:DNA-binding LytR/AlgR family response regulator